MTSFIVLPTLTAWVEGGLSAILKSTTEEAFDSAFDRFISQHANITVNGQHLSRDNYKQQLLGESAVNKRAAEVKFDGVVEVSTDKEEPIKAGLVGVFYVSTVQLKELVFGAPAETQGTSSLNVVVEQDKSLPQPPPSPIRGDFDGRRVASLNQVFITKSVPITPPHSTSSA